MARRFELERVMGIEPTPSAWEAEVLPLNYTRFSVGYAIRRSSLASSHDSSILSESSTIGEAIVVFANLPFDPIDSTKKGRRLFDSRSGPDRSGLDPACIGTLSSAGV
jgi:hypothetical protein